METMWIFISFNLLNIIIIYLLYFRLENKKLGKIIEDLQRLVEVVNVRIRENQELIDSFNKIKVEKEEEGEDNDKTG